MTSRPTFKKGPNPTGLYAVGHPYADTDIKMDGKVVGMLSAPSAFGHDGWKVRLMVQRPVDVQWRWVVLKVVHPTEKAARSWVREHWKAINEKFPLHRLD